MIGAEWLVISSVYQPIYIFKAVFQRLNAIFSPRRNLVLVQMYACKCALLYPILLCFIFVCSFPLTKNQRVKIESGFMWCGVLGSRSSAGHAASRSRIESVASHRSSAFRYGN